MRVAAQLQVTSVRSRSPRGGVIFAGETDSGEKYVVVCNYALVPDASVIDKGQRWEVEGPVSIRSVEAANGFRFKETQIEAAQATLLRPAGRNIISWIAASPDCPGIGQVKAAKLYHRFGPSLVDLIETGDMTALTEVLSDEAATLLCKAFEKFKLASTLLWLDQMGLPVRIGASVVSYYQEQAQAKVEANPYALISFEANWKVVDQIARTRFGIRLDDPRRLESAIEEALYRGLKLGHTCLPATELHSRLRDLLKSTVLSKAAMAAGNGNSQYQIIDGRYQPTGPYLIERYLATRLHTMVCGEEVSGQASLFAQIASHSGGLDVVLDDYESSHGIKLAAEQRQTVLNSASAHLSLILGGAGTGKTTVLKALYTAMEEVQPGVQIYQLALGGRAAQRMTAATGRNSMTIVGFLTKVDAGEIEFGAVVVVDESSMVDVILMYRLLRHMPPGVRLILVGDPSQISPIGPGLVLHALVGLKFIPQVELKVVQRQSAASGIPQVAAAVRNHQVPSWAAYTGRPDVGVSFVPCPMAQIEAMTQQIYGEIGGTGADFNVQILSITNRGVGGVIPLNAALHAHYQAKAEQVFCFDPVFGIVGASTLDREQLKVGDLVMYTENDYELGLRNGSLGTIIAALSVSEADDHCCTCDFEGVEYSLTSAQLQSVTHAYSITVHKGQGSQFNRVIVPIRKSKLLDQALIYTAITRGVEQVVLVGDEQAAIAAILAPASATLRHIAFPTLLAQARDGLLAD